MVRLAWTLRRSLLEVLDDVAAPALLGDEALKSQNALLPRCVSFVTHGLGAWIVREALASPAYQNPAYITSRLIFMDAPVTNSSAMGGLPDYSTYLKQMGDMYRITPADTQFEDCLKTCLLTIDRNFELFLTYSKCHERVENLLIWTNEESHSKSTWTDRILHFVPFYPIPWHLISLEKLHLLRPLSWNDTPQNFDRKQPQGTLRLPHNPNHGGSMSSASNESMSNTRTAPLSDLELIQDLDTTNRMATSYLQRGEFNNAETLYTRMHSILSALSKPCPPLKLLQVRLKIAYTKLCLGKYEETKNNLETIQQGINDAHPGTDAGKRLKTELDFDCRRRLAEVMLHAGRWKDAGTEFEKLRTQSGNTGRQSVDFKIIRDLALVYAYLGDYQKGRSYITQARSRLNSQGGSSIHRDREERLQLKHSVLGLVESTIDMLSGNYHRALKIVSKSLASLQATLGPRHFRTLEAANIKAWCLVLEGRFADGISDEYRKPLADAESLCVSTWRNLAKTLSGRHCLTLNSTECLVRIFICQGRLAEAIGTGELLHKNVTQSLGERHPQAISSKSQVAAAYLEQGNYRASRSFYEDIYAEAKKILGPNHPRSVKYRCELARACLYHGEIEKAFDIAIKGTTQLIALYGYNQLSASTLSTSPISMRELRGYIANKPNHQLHPDLIYGLQLLAEIELRKHRTKGLEGDLDIAEQTLKFLAENLSNSSGSASVLKAAVHYDLAIILQEGLPTSNRTSYESIGILEGVVRDRQRLLGDDHPDTLQAHRELSRSQLNQEISDTVNNTDDDIDGREYVSTVESIWTSLESRYGSQFHHTLHSRLWRWTMLSAFGGFQSHEIEEEAQSIGGILSNPEVLTERLIESIWMRNHIAKFLIKFDLLSPAQHLLNSVEQDIEKALKEDANKSLRRALERCTVVIEELKSVCREDIAK